MGSKVPLAERFPENGKQTMTQSVWKKDSESLDQKPLKPTSHLSVKVDRENANKRSRDCPSQSRWQHVPQGTGMRGSKKSRGPFPQAGGSAKGAKKAAPLPPGRPRLTRRVGGIAPNGNPQCWYAPHESEMDPHRIAQRLKQVEFGKNSAGYKAYITAVPRTERKGDDPQTPDVRTKCSKRCFDGLLRSWRRRLHRYDPPDEEGGAGAGPSGSGVGAVKDEPGSDDINDNMPDLRINVGDEPRTPVAARRRPAGDLGDRDNSRGSDWGPPGDLGGDDKPVPWEEIERMSLCSPLWGDDKDSDISEPDSQDRVTIYTADLSPTASELACMQQAETQSELWGTPRSRFSMPKDEEIEEPADGGVARSPPSPFSPWAPWGTAKASFADALRSPVAILDLEAPAGSIPLSSKITSAGADEKPPAGSTSVEPAGTSTSTQEVTPVTFGDAFALGLLRDTVTAPSSATPASMFGKGMKVHGGASIGDECTPAPAHTDITVSQPIEAKGASISFVMGGQGPATEMALENPSTLGAVLAAGSDSGRSGASGEGSRGCVSGGDGSQDAS